MNTLERILKLIEQKGLSNNRFEKEAGLAIASIQAWKSGKAKPSLQSIQKIANYCDVSVEYLLTGEQTSSYLTKKETAKSLISDLTPEEIKKLLEYKDFLISQRDKK